ncbi:MAG TPA: hypothetical protein VGH46_09730 [Gaiellaceae bacterium]|jgi:hypothetical protein
MALARVVTFEGVGSDRIAQMSGDIRNSEPPEGMPPSELLVLHDPDSEQAVAIVFFESEDDYQKGHEILDAMPASDTPGGRTSVKKYDVAVRMSTLAG